MPNLDNPPIPDKLKFRDSEYRICAQCGAWRDVEPTVNYAYAENGRLARYEALWLCPQHTPPPPAPDLAQRIAKALEWARQTIAEYEEMRQGDENA